MRVTAEQVREAIMSADRWEKPMGDTGMTNTHLIIRDDGWQAIADELNAALGRGECHITRDFKCDACGHQYPYRNFRPYETCDGRTAYKALYRDELACEMPRFCPNCGRRVVDE